MNLEYIKYSNLYNFKTNNYMPYYKIEAIYKSFHNTKNKYTYYYESVYEVVITLKFHISRGSTITVKQISEAEYVKATRYEAWLAEI